MGRQLVYRPGSYYVTDDRTGFPQRSERTRKEWNGLRVDETVWEPRQPQDLVRGVKDQQSVPDARPLAPNVFVGPVFTQMEAAAVVGQTLIEVGSTFRFAPGSSMSVMLDNGENFTTTVDSVGAGTITMTDGLPYTAASGNNVTSNTSRVPAGQAVP